MNLLSVNCRSVIWDSVMCRDTDSTAKHRVRGKVLGWAYTPVFFFNNTLVGAQLSMYTEY